MMCKTNVSLNKSEGKDVPNLTGNSLSDNVGALTEVLELFSEEKSSQFFTDGAAPLQMPSYPQATHLPLPGTDSGWSHTTPSVWNSWHR